jgi:hypothetical protein
LFFQNLEIGLGIPPETPPLHPSLRTYFQLTAKFGATIKVYL